MAITGPVGSGKSSLISALLGEMCKITGRASINVSWCLCSSSCYLPFLFVLQMHVLNKENKWFTLMMWLASVLILVFALMVTVNMIENLILAAYLWSAFWFGIKCMECQLNSIDCRHTAVTANLHYKKACYQDSFSLVLFSYFCTFCSWSSRKSVVGCLNQNIVFRQYFWYRKELISIDKG